MGGSRIVIHTGWSLYQRLPAHQSAAKTLAHNKGPNDAERRRGFAMHDDLDFTYRISDRDAALPMLIDMGYHK